MKEALSDLEEQKANLAVKLSKFKLHLDARGADKKMIKKYLLQYADLSKFTFEEKKKAIQTFAEKVIVLLDSVQIHSIVNTIGRGERT